VKGAGFLFKLFYEASERSGILTDSKKSKTGVL